MGTPENKKNRNKKEKKLREETRIGGKSTGFNEGEKLEIEQTRIENRREADLDDKTPAGDAGVEDNDQPQANDPIGESNY
jgi:hypothetical protein